MKVQCYPKITIATWFSPITCFYTLNIALVPSQNCPLVPIVADQKYTGVYTNVFFICFLYYFSLFCFVFLLYYVCESTHAYTYPLYKFIHVLALLPSLTGMKNHYISETFPDLLFQLGVLWVFKKKSSKF